MLPPVDDPLSWLVGRVMERVRREPVAMKLEVISREADGRLRLRSQQGLDMGPQEQTNPAYNPAPGTKVWTVAIGGNHRLVLSP